MPRGRRANAAENLLAASVSDFVKQRKTERLSLRLGLPGMVALGSSF